MNRPLTIEEIHSRLEDALGAAFMELDGTAAGAQLQESGTETLEFLEGLMRRKRN